MKSARATRPGPEEGYNTTSKLNRRVTRTRRLPRATAARNMAVEMFGAGRDRAAAAAAAQRRHPLDGSS
jgi:hypothetical protein